MLLCMSLTFSFLVKGLPEMTIETQIAASQTALACVRMALLISTTPEEQNACLIAFVSQANRVMQLSGWEASE